MSLAHLRGVGSNRRISDAGDGTAGGGGDGAVSEEIGGELFWEQIKFAVLQTLVLIELATTSCSALVYGLCGAGAAILWFFCVVLQGEQAKNALVTLYPLILMVSTMLLSVIALIKVFYVQEQSSLSLVFLGVAFTSDHVLLVRTLIPRIGKFNLGIDPSSSGNNNEGTLTVDRHPCVAFFATIVDWFTTFILIIFALAGSAICAFHAAIGYPLTFLIDKYLMGRLLDEWERETVTLKNREIEAGDRVGSKIIIDDKRRQAIRNAMWRSVFLFLTVIVVDLEFLAIAISMAEITGGVQLGGSPIGSNATGGNC